MNNSSVLLTADGFESLKKELDELKNVKLLGVISRVAKAREDGDLSENSEQTNLPDSSRAPPFRILSIQIIIMVYAKLF